MMRLTEETLISIAALAQELPGRPHVGTVHRWRTRGVRGVKLAAVLVGGRWHSSREAFGRFVENTTKAASFDTDEADASISARDADVDRALDEAGL